jgi:hypothetical protein
MRNFIFCLKIQHILFMAHSSVVNLPEILEQILHFLAIDKSLYPTLFVCRLWYRCGVPILWKRVELKGRGIKNRPRLERFIKIVRGRQKSVYSSSITHLKISYYHSLSDKKIKDIVSSDSRIIPKSEVSQFMRLCRCYWHPLSKIY